MFLEEKLIYRPAKFPKGEWDLSRYKFDSQSVQPQIQDCYIRTIDNVMLHGWYCKPVKDNKIIENDAVLLWFHGNSGNLADQFALISQLIKLEMDLFLIDYRGYGRSEGTPTEEGLYLDAHTAWDFLVYQKKIPETNVIIGGEGLGAAIAVDLACGVEPAGLIIQSGFTSMPDLISVSVPFVPSFLVKTKMDSLQKVRTLRCPKLIIHSPADETIPYSFGMQLFEVSSEPREFYLVQNAKHSQILQVAGDSYLNKVMSFIGLSLEEVRKKSKMMRDSLRRA